MDMPYSSELILSLRAFGLTEREAVIYLGGLELGSTTILELARRANLPRTTLYPILEHLCNEEVFTHSTVEGKELYTATSPKELSQIFTEKDRLLKEALPDLEALSGLRAQSSEIAVFQGTDGFKQLWRNIFRSGVTEYRMVTNGMTMIEYVKEPYLVERVITERVQRGIKSIQLIPETKLGKQIVEKDTDELRESRFLPSNTVLGATMVIFGDEVAFITARTENAMVVIASGDIAKTHRVLFDALWETARKP
jgi:sugar-specific transcriptional regulator TrmB